MCFLSGYHTTRHEVSILDWKMFWDSGFSKSNLNYWRTCQMVNYGRISCKIINVIDDLQNDLQNRENKIQLIVQFNVWKGTNVFQKALFIYLFIYLSFNGNHYEKISISILKFIICFKALCFELFCFFLIFFGLCSSCQSSLS